MRFVVLLSFFAWVLWLPIVELRAAPPAFATQGETFAMRNPQTGELTPHFFRGVNLGLGIPGFGPNCQIVPQAEYERWFDEMQELGADSVRVYSLQPPAFYRALANHNQRQPATPLYLFQGVWLLDTDPPYDLTVMTARFDRAIAATVDAIHGRRGTGEPDLSRWTVAWLVGREVMPFEVRETDRLHPDLTRFRGKVFRLDQGTPTEAWLAARLEHTVLYERGTYGCERPVGFSSWPPLDPLSHPTESKDSGEDNVSVDLANLRAVNAPAGFFASYHVYPYNPDFMNEDPGYRRVRDAGGMNPYRGYLRELRQHYRGIPLLVAEFGVPSSWGNSRANPAGMHHGGLDERQQGEVNARLLQTIYDTGCAGALYFSFVDEWWKKNWITAKLNFPHERRRFWHNVTDPEANYGLIAFSPPPPTFDRWPAVTGSGELRRAEVAADAAYFHVRVTLDRPWSASEKRTLWIGFDTDDDATGELLFPDGSSNGRRHEFLLAIPPRGPAQLLVTPAYDLFGIWHNVAGPEQLFHSTATRGNGWRLVRWRNCAKHVSPDGKWVFPATNQEIGRLHVATSTQTASSLDAVTIEGDNVSIRLPWTLLNFTDPSQRQVMNDDRKSAATLETAESDGIAVSVTLGTESLFVTRACWDKWDAVPPFVERRKDSFPILREAFRTLPSTPPRP